MQQVLHIAYNRYYTLMLQIRISYRLQYLQHARVIREVFCDGLEMKSTTPLGWIQQAGESETASVGDCKCLNTILSFIIPKFRTELKPQVNVR